MTMLDEQKAIWLPGSRRRRALGLLAGSLGAVSLLASACGGSDVTCGAGTTKQGSQCVATGPITGAGGSSESDASTDGASAGGEGTGGSAEDSGNGQGGTAGVDGGKTDGAVAPTDTLDFAGVTAVCPADQTPPQGATAPAGLLRVTWTPASYPSHPDAVIHYEIFEATASGKQNFKVPTDTAPPGSTSLILTDRTKGTFYYVVRAIADVGSAKDENVVEVSGKAAFDDKKPDFADGAKAADAAGPTSMTVSWDAASDDHTDPAGLVYRVYWTDKAGGALSLGAVSLPGATSAVVTGLPAANADYYFRVNAVDAAGNVDDNKVDVRGTTGPDVTPPRFGGCTSVSDISAATATVTWGPAVDDTSPASKISYTVYAVDVTVTKGQSLDGLNFGTFTGVTSGKVTGLSPATFYRFICRAKDEALNEDQNFVSQTGSTSTDGDPPTFTGVATAAPSDTSDEAAIDLTWLAASDTQSLAKNIVYRVYASTTAGGENFGGDPTVTSAPGVTGITVSNSNLFPVVAQSTPLATSASNTDFYFVVRARDEAGNEDTNTTELKATTLVSFKDDIQPIFNNKCAILGCHTAADPTTPPKQGQNLDDGSAYDSIVGIPTVEMPSVFRVSTTKTPLDSYMFRKITGTGTFTGSTMPPAISPNGPLGDTPDNPQKGTLILWISQGAKRN